MTLQKEEKEYLIKLGKHIVALREEKGIKQYELADLLDIDVRVMRRIEKGKTNIQILSLFKIATVLGAKREDLINLSSY